MYTVLASVMQKSTVDLSYAITIKVFSHINTSLAAQEEEGEACVAVS